MKRKRPTLKQTPTVQTVLLNLLELVIEYLFFWNKSSEHLLSLLGEKEENNNEVTGKTTMSAFHIQADRSPFSRPSKTHPISSQILYVETAFNHQSGTSCFFWQAINYLPNAFHRNEVKTVIAPLRFHKFFLTCCLFISFQKCTLSTTQQRKPKVSISPLHLRLKGSNVNAVTLLFVYQLRSLHRNYSTLNCDT